MNKLQLVLAIFTIITLLVACDSPFMSDERKLERVYAAKRDARKADLEKNRAAILAEIEQLLAAGKISEAVQRTGQYHQFSDPDIVALQRRIVDLQRQAQIQVNLERERELLATIRTTKPTDRYYLLNYYAELEKLAPENKTYSENWKRIQQEIYRQEEANKTKELAAERARRKKEGVSIGMTKNEVLMSNWGRPERVNKTSTARGTREQWVYGSRSYLYFDESGTLTTVQN